MTPLIIQYIALAVIVMLCVLVYTGDDPPKRPLLWPSLIIINAIMCVFATWSHIVAFEHAHPWVFWGYALPAIMMMVGAFFSGLKDKFAWFLVTGLMAMLPGINVVAVAIVFGAIAYDVICDPKYMWRGMKTRFNFTKE